MKRFPFLDWTRGLAVVIMIECHVFNSFARIDVRGTGAYVLSQFVGGMAAVLFLFMTGMTLAFQMDSLDRREARVLGRWTGALRRAGYVLALAYAFRITNFLGALPNANWREILKVDILNSMGVGMAALAILAVLRPDVRAQSAVVAGLAVAGVSPLISSVEWGVTPFWIREYLQPNPARFPFFPWTAYIAFGVAAGAVLKRTPGERVERLMQWAVLAAVPLIFGAWYFSNLPFSVYPKSEFWIDSPALILIRTGVVLLMLAGAYLWTEFGAGGGWSWMQALGKTSLMVYWVHVMIVYGDLAKPLRRALTIPQAALATVVVTGSMVALSAARLRWRERRTARLRAAAAA